MAEHIDELLDGVAFIEKNDDKDYYQDDDKVYARRNEAADTIKKLKFL